jgi:transposase
MLTFPHSLKVFVSMDAADLRKSFTGLWALTVNVLKDDPSDGSLYVYTNRRHNRVKILYWDGTGLWVMTKRLEQGTFSWPKGIDVQNGRLQLSPEALALLLDGVDLRRGSLRPWYQR